MTRPGRAGYSGTPLVDKLGIKAGSKLALLGAPADFDATLGELPHGVQVVRGTARVARGRDFDVAVVFVTRAGSLCDAFSKVTPRMRPEGGAWIAWPKKASGVATDMTEDEVRKQLLPTGWVDNKVCAIDATWSGLRMVLRKELRPPRAPHRRK